ncbi:unnamed protein product [Didymodactylos carnosus]|uniref:E3 ubiquitin-protein ligase RBBP6 n=1 Tax=Didymodactylos carnosus TaxID=1234261 RepID=A0A814CTC8_9BILA|nr:unnamed protein product [Didymodactylos carnosus]CAF3724809.1 unnamed protein product [Didymodactylos carnosus]
MSSIIRYRFKTAKTDNYEYVKFNGRDCSLGELKRLIMEKCSKSHDPKYDYELTVSNASTFEEYKDQNALIPCNASVVVARKIRGFLDPLTPLTNYNKTTVDDATLDIIKAQIKPEERDMAVSITVTGSHQPEQMTEVEKIKEIQKASHTKFSSSHRQLPSTFVPASYICHKCNQHGHHKRMCPLNAVNEGGKEHHTPYPSSYSAHHGRHIRDKGTSGLPRSDLISVPRAIPGSLRDDSGSYVIPKLTAEALVKKREDAANRLKQKQQIQSGISLTTPISAVQLNSSTKADDNSIPKDLLCPLCNKIYVDAVIAPCCHFSFCDECKQFIIIKQILQRGWMGVRTRLIESEENECPSCHRQNVIIDQINPNLFLRSHVQRWFSENQQQRQKYTLPSYSSSTTVNASDPDFDLALTKLNEHYYDDMESSPQHMSSAVQATTTALKTKSSIVTADQQIKKSSLPQQTTVFATRPADMTFEDGKQQDGSDGSQIITDDSENASVSAPNMTLTDTSQTMTSVDPMQTATGPKEFFTSSEASTTTQSSTIIPSSSTITTTIIASSTENSQQQQYAYGVPTNSYQHYGQQSYNYPPVSMQPSMYPPRSIMPLPQAMSPYVSAPFGGRPVLPPYGHGYQIPPHLLHHQTHPVHHLIPSTFLPVHHPAHTNVLPYQTHPHVQYPSPQTQHFQSQLNPSQVSPSITSSAAAAAAAAAALLSEEEFYREKQRLLQQIHGRRPRHRRSSSARSPPSPTYRRYSNHRRLSPGRSSTSQTRYNTRRPSRDRRREPSLTSSRHFRRRSSRDHNHRPETLTSPSRRTTDRPVSSQRSYHRRHSNDRKPKSRANNDHYSHSSSKYREESRKNDDKRERNSGNRRYNSKSRRSSPSQQKKHSSRSREHSPHRTGRTENDHYQQKERHHSHENHFDQARHEKERSRHETFNSNPVQTQSHTSPHVSLSVPQSISFDTNFQNSTSINTNSNLSLSHLPSKQSKMDSDNCPVISVTSIKSESSSYQRKRKSESPLMEPTLITVPNNNDKNKRTKVESPSITEQDEHKQEYHHPILEIYPEISLVSTMMTDDDNKVQQTMNDGELYSRSKKENIIRLLIVKNVCRFTSSISNERYNNLSPPTDRSQSSSRTKITSSSTRNNTRNNKEYLNKSISKSTTEKSLAHPHLSSFVAKEEGNGNNSDSNGRKHLQMSTASTSKLQVVVSDNADQNLDKELSVSRKVYATTSSSVPSKSEEEYRSHYHHRSRTSPQTRHVSSPDRHQKKISESAYSSIRRHRSTSISPTTTQIDGKLKTTTKMDERDDVNESDDNLSSKKFHHKKDRKEKKHKKHHHTHLRHMIKSESSKIVR